MPDLSRLTSMLRAIESDAMGAQAGVEGITNAVQKLAALRVEFRDIPDAVAKIDKLSDSLGKLAKAERESTKAQEENRKSLEAMVGSNKALAEVLDRTIMKWSKGKQAVEAVTNSYQALKRAGDLGAVITNVASLSKGFSFLGAVVGGAVTAYIKFQDRMQATNKAIIESTAATGRFAEGMGLAETNTGQLTSGLVRYATHVGELSANVEKYVGVLGQLGFTIDEMGIDKATGEVNTLTQAISKQTNTWSALSASIAVARASGLSTSDVMAQMQMQVKTLGNSVEFAVNTFTRLNIAAVQSKLSTSILLPILRGTQDAFKYLGIDSSGAALAIGAAGKAAKAAGLGAGVAVEVMGKAMAGLAGMDFGTMAFMGQQMGMGGGLKGGFQFRQQIGERPGEIAAQIGRVIGNIMGGTGRLITEEQARTNEMLASQRLAQEQMAAQTFGFSQNEARAYINLATRLQDLVDIGQGDSETAETTRKQLENMGMGESEWRDKTLTAQEKIANVLEMIFMLMGRTFVTFARAFMGGAAGKGGGVVSDLMGEAFGAIKSGKGIGSIQNFWERLDKSMTENVDPIVEKWGTRFGKITNFLIDKWYLAIPAALAGKQILSRVFSHGMGGIAEGATGGAGGLLGKQFSLGGLVRGIGGVLEGIPGAFKGLISGAWNITTSWTNLKTAISGVRGSLGSLIGSLKGVQLGSLGFGSALIAAGVAAWAAHEYFSAIEDAANQRLKAEEQLTGAVNKNIQSMNEYNGALEKITGLSNLEAVDAFRKIQAGKQSELTEKQKNAWEKTQVQFLNQAQNEIKRVLELTKATESRLKGKDSTESSWMNERFGNIIGKGAVVPAWITQLQTESETAQKMKTQAQVEPKSPKGDAWDITKSGWLYTKPGDVVINAKSLGISQGGREGAGLSNLWSKTHGLAGDLLMGTGGRTATGRTDTARTTNQPIEQDIILRLKGYDDRFGQVFEEHLKISIEKDLVAGGKTGMSVTRMGVGKGWA